MIVCVCNNVSDHKIRRAVETGKTSMLELRSEFGIGNCCGKCNACAKTILRDCLAERSQPVPRLALAA